MLKIEHLSKTYGEKKAVDDLSLHIRPGEIYGFIGHNGAGKTTTIKSCAGILQFEQGEIYIDGKSVKADPLGCKQQLAYIPDNPDLYEFLSGVKYLNFVADIFGVSKTDREARIEKYADLFALTGDLADEFTDVSMLPPLLEGLTALAPTFYVTGNHEWVLSREKRQALFDLLDAAGVIRLPNECRLLEKGGASIVLAGVDDPNGPYDQKRPAQLVREIRQQYGKDAYILMLSHRNDELPLWAHMGVQTVLCGHGHGGIVRLPGIGAVFGTHMDLFPDYTAGLYEKDGTAMVVSRGLGGSRKLPLRIGNRPEVVTVVLRTEN